MLISWYGEVPPVVRMVVTPLRQIEARRRELELHAAPARRVERVVVHADDAGDDGVARQIHRPDAGRHLRGRGRTECR